MREDGRRATRVGHAPPRRRADEDRRAGDGELDAGVPGEYTVRSVDADTALVRHRSRNWNTVFELELEHETDGWRRVTKVWAPADCSFAPVDDELARPGKPLKRARPIPVPHGGFGPRAGCASFAIYEPGPTAGRPTVAEAVPRSGTDKPQSLSVRHQDARHVVVRERFGDHLHVYELQHWPRGWAKDKGLAGALGCPPLEKEFARPGEPLHAAEPEPA